MPKAVCRIPFEQDPQQCLRLRRKELRHTQLCPRRKEKEEEEEEEEEEGGGRGENRVW